MSDLHFGYDQDATMSTQRENLLNSLIDQVENENINLVIITGDIVWQCKENGYSEAEIWLNKLREKINIPFEKFIVCTGNHDVNHEECAEISYISDQSKIDSILKFERLDKLSKRFDKFIKFCDKMGFAKPLINGEICYLTGSLKIENINFIIQNTSWYALSGGSFDKNKLWIGRNFVDFFIKNHNNSDITINLQHHPYTWLNDNEIISNDSNASLYERISEMCNIEFTGHTHGNIQEPNYVHNRMYSFTSGAVYKDANYYHNFSIYEINNKKIVRKAFGSIDRYKWEAIEEKEYALKNEKTISQAITLQSDSPSVAFKNALDSIKVNMINVTEKDFSSNRIIIWPVVPRLLLTSIHLAQLELMSILCKQFGWSIVAIISNCGSKTLDDTEEIAFKEKIQKYCEKLGIENISFDYLYKFFGRNHPLVTRILDSFINISSKIIMPQLASINEKKYEESKKAETRNLPVLDYILPILQFSVVQALSKYIKKETGKKSIVVAGNDEKIQWSEAVSAIGVDYIGAMLIPELNKTNGININQDNQDQNIKSIIECHSKEQLRENINKGNVASWYYRMFVVLSSYNDIQSIDIFNTGLSPSDKIEFWTDENSIPQCVDANKLINKIWGKIDNCINCS